MSKDWCGKVLVLLCSWCVCNAHANQAHLSHVQTFYGEVGASNFTYYKLTLSGNVIVQLQSYEGDADLYVSTETLKPRWDDYTMKSDTCGDDIVQMHEFHQRPVGIGVYGYIQHPLSKYKLSVFVDESQHKFFSDESISDANRFGSPTSEQSSVPDDEQDESILWRLFVWFIKVTLEVLL